MTTPPSYNGNEPYIFISYAHKDTDRVLPIITAMAMANYRVWYDEGIHPGTEWDDFIAEKMIRSSLIISMISQHYLTSQNCIDELKFARNENKKQLLVYLEDAALPAGMRMRFDSVQALFVRSSADIEPFCQKLFTTPFIHITQKRTPTAIETLHLSHGNYVGEVQNGKRHGQGVMSYFDGDRYEGAWANDEPNGQGIYTFANGMVYTGEWKNGEYHGYGIIEFPGGSGYRGEWANGEFHGQGVYRAPDKSEIEGIWENGILRSGTTRLPDGTVYRGSYDEHLLFHGKGSVIYGDGTTYDGEWSHGHCQGHGVGKVSSGDIYDGEWKDDLYNGYGTYTYADGRVLAGIWMDGRFLG